MYIQYYAMHLCMGVLVIGNILLVRLLGLAYVTQRNNTTSIPLDIDNIFVRRFSSFSVLNLMSIKAMMI